MKRVLSVVGARPNFMKVAPIHRAFSAVPELWEHHIVHTGQHYDAAMSDAFFQDLDMPHPSWFMGVGSGSHATQTAKVMTGFEQVCTEANPDYVIVVGDVNSTIACALVSVKMGIRTAHVEAGLRSFDRSMPEEINRILTDAISDWLYTTEAEALDNLRREGVAESRVRLVGNVMIDTLFHQLEAARAGRPWERLGVTPGQFALLTLHRPSNVDDPMRLESILRAVHEISRQLPVVFAIHPRTRARLDAFGFSARPELGGFQSVDPLPYRDSLALIDAARLVLTDSGGLQEEACVLRVPCLTLRENTERPITLASGANQLVGWKTEAILEAFAGIWSGPQRIGTPPPLWDGRAAERIADHLSQVLS